MFEWQKKIIDKYYNRSSFGLWLDMGLGKTPLSLAMAEKNHCNKIIVVTLKSKALEDEKVKGSFKWWNLKRDDNCDMLVVNYESLYNHKDTRNLQLKDDVKDFINGCVCCKTAIILDESHYLKSNNSLRTKAVKLLKIKLKCKTSSVYTYLLTGTPFTIGYIDLYSQLSILGLEMSKTKFIDNFCVRGRIRGLYEWQQPIVSYKNIDKLFDLVHQYAITIKSDEVANNLPLQTFVNITMQESNVFKLLTREKVQNSLLNEFENKKDNNLQLVNNYYYRDIDYPQSRWIADTTASYWMRARQLSIGFQGNKDDYKWFDNSRLEKLKTFLTENEDNYIIFYNYTPELVALFEILDDLKYKIDVYCGEIKSLYNYERHQKLSKDEKLNSHKNVILANFASGSTGMNWQEYHKCIMFSIPLYKDYAQGIKRIHRLGQEEKCIYYIFSQDNFLDNSMIESLKNKQDYTDKQFESDLKRVQDLIIGGI